MDLAHEVGKLIGQFLKKPYFGHPGQICCESQCVLSFGDWRQSVRRKPTRPAFCFSCGVRCQRSKTSLLRLSRVAVTLTEGEAPFAGRLHCSPSWRAFGAFGQPALMRSLTDTACSSPRPACMILLCSSRSMLIYKTLMEKARWEAASQTVNG